VRFGNFRETAGVNPFTGTIFARARAFNPVTRTSFAQTQAFNPFTGLAFESDRASNPRFGTRSISAFGYAGGYGYPGSYGYGYPGSYGGGYPYGGYGGYSGDPYNGYLNGYANAYDYGQYLINEQQSYVVREQARQAKLETRRRVFDEYLYERRNAPTWEDDRERFLGDELRRSQNVPPLTEVQSGKALNVLLADLQKSPAKTGDAGALHLDSDLVKRLNFTTTTGTGNIGLLKDAGRLTWPRALMGDEYREVRERLTASAREAVAQASVGGRVDPSLLDEMAKDLDRLDEQLRNSVSQTRAPEYIDARRFLNQFTDAVKALGQPDAGNHFNGRYTFQGKTVADLVRFMSERGLRFAPAAPGDEAAYAAVHQALTAYDLASRPMTRELIER
jgi:hypothetical protein